MYATELDYIATHFILVYDSNIKHSMLNYSSILNIWLYSILIYSVLVKYITSTYMIFDAIWLDGKSIRSHAVILDSSILNVILDFCTSF